MSKHSPAALRGALDAIYGSDHYLVITLRDHDDKPPTIDIYSDQKFGWVHLLNHGRRFYEDVMLNRSGGEQESGEGEEERS